MIPAKRNALQSTARIGRPPHPEPYRACTYYMPLALYDAISEEARRTGRSMSRIVSDAVRKALGGGQDE